jgi:hypothetical protein
MGMKAMVMLATIAVAGFAAQAAAQSLPAGNYAINGTVTALTGSSCPLALKLPATGVLYYPGPGRVTTQLLLESVALQKSVTIGFMSAFPPVPANGLNGWSSSSPVSPNYAQYQNGHLTGGGTAAVLSFNLIQSQGGPLAFAQGTITLSVDSIGPCAETVQVMLQKVAGFKQIK